MADETENPFLAALRGREAPPRFAGPQGSVTGLIDRVTGVPTQDQYLAAERAHVRSRDDATRADALAKEQQTLQKLAGAYSAALQGSGGDVKTALTTLLQKPEFLMLGTGSAASFMQNIKTIQEMAQGPAPEKGVVVGEGGALVSPSTGKELFRNPKGPTESTIDKEMAKKSVEQWGSIVEEGQQARVDMLGIEELKRLGDRIGTGGAAAIRGHLARVGIDLGDAGDIQAFESMVDRLTPAQRGGLPGAASNLDVTMFKSALPSLIRTPEGNRTIIRTMEALAKAKMQRGEIADSVYEGERTIPQALRDIRKLPDPLSEFKELSKKEKGGDDPAQSGLAQGEIRTGRGGKQYRFKGGNQHDRRAWELVE
ncbi:MAG: hypothetical protein ACKVP3_11110 [Hyphomicrobiaceae bacterium]